MTNKKQEDKGELLVVPTPAFKLKDYPSNRIFMPIDLERQFGFKPDVILIEKVRGHHDTLIVKAVLTQKEVDIYKEKNKEI